MFQDTKQVKYLQITILEDHQPATRSRSSDRAPRATGSCSAELRSKIH